MSGARPLFRICDSAATLIAALAGIYMATHRPVAIATGILPGGFRFAAAGLAGAAAVALGLRMATRAGLTVRTAARAICYGLVAVLLLAADGASRYAKLWDFPRYPPRPQDSYANRLGRLSSVERARWGVLIAAHDLADHPVSHGELVLPGDWPFPDDVEIGIQPGEHQAVHIWGRAKDGVAYCLTIPAAGSVADPVRDAAECTANRRAPPGVEFKRPRRVAPALPPPIAGGQATSWVEYRADARRSGANAVAPIASNGWRRTIDGPVRSSASVAGNLVLIGAHGTGAFAALDVATGAIRWATRLPNWVHQEAVSDGRTVVVGFGSTYPSFAGREPSGVAAYDLVSGTHRWTSFDESSVMTSPVISDSFVVYVTAAGTLRKRNLNTGALVGRLTLPGGVIMGPPAILGDTMIVALDVNGACAVLVSDLKQLWCRTIPGVTMTGHSGPAASNGIAFFSGMALLNGLSPAEFLDGSMPHQWRLLRTAFYPQPEPAGQRFIAVNLRDGSTRWTSRLIAGSIPPKGNNAGTAAIRDSVGVIVMPVADSVVAFRLATGATLWARPAHGSRGPPLIIDDHVVVAGRDGIIESRDLRTGALSCRLRRKIGFDRAGPTIAGNLLIFANLKGEVEAIPGDRLQRCVTPSPGPRPAQH